MAVNGCYGKTFQERFPQTREMTLDTFLDQWYKGMFLSLKTDGKTQESVSPKMETESWSGGCWTLNISESLNDAVESSLYSILEHGGGYPPVLFESESVPRDFEKGRGKRESTTSSLGENSSGNGYCTLDTSDQNLVKNQDDMAIVSKVFVKGTRPHSKDEAPTWKEGTVVNTLNTFDLGETRCNELVCESKKVLPKSLEETLEKIVMEPCGEDDTLMVSQDTFVNVADKISLTLRARGYKAPNAVCYEEPVVAIEGNGQRPSHRGAGINDNGVQYTLNTTEVHAVAYKKEDE